MAPQKTWSNSPLTVLTCVIEPINKPSHRSLAPCGNGNKQFNEECDDGNEDDGDGCDSNCNIEAGWNCQGNHPMVCFLAGCGDGTLIPSEQCDDGNNIDGDGCSYNCLIEQDYTCDGLSPTTCQSCGNGNIEGTEQCDDSNTDSGDGCDSSCQVEAGWTCDSSNPSQCSATCGDGLLNGDEECDDGNIIPSDGCSDTCLVEDGYTCTQTDFSECMLDSECGNGIIEEQEECDDGNLQGSDGCSSQCEIEEIYSCNGEPSYCNIHIVKTTTESNIGTSVQASVGFGISLQVFVAFILGQSLMGVWEMINLLQLLRYMSLFSLYYPKLLLVCLSYVNIVNFENDIFSFLYLKHIDTTKLDHKEIDDYRYVNQSIDSKSILILCSDLFFYIIISIPYFFFVFAVVLVTKPIQNSEDKPCLKRACIKFMNKLHRQKRHFWNVCIRFGFEIYIDILFCSLLNITNMTFKNSVDIYSDVVAIIWFTIMTLFTLFILVVCLQGKNNLNAEAAKASKISTLIQDLRKGKISIWLHSVFLARRAFLVLIDLTLSSFRHAQIILFSLAVLAVIAFKMVFKPYKSKLNNIQDLCGEFILLSLCICYFSFLSKETELATSGKGETISYVCLGIIFSIIGHFYVFMIIRSCIAYRDKIKNSKVAPEERYQRHNKSQTLDEECKGGKSLPKMSKKTSNVFISHNDSIKRLSSANHSETFEEQKCESIFDSGREVYKIDTERRMIFKPKKSQFSHLKGEIKSIISGIPVDLAKKESGQHIKQLSTSTLIVAKDPLNEGDESHCIKYTS